MVIAPAAMWMAYIEEPQNRFTVAPATDNGNPRPQCHEPPHVQTLFALGEGTADDQIFHILRIGPGFFDETPDNLGRELVGPNP